MAPRQPRPHKPLTVGRLILIIVATIGSVALLAVILLLVLVGLVFDGLKSHNESCSKQASTIISRNEAAIASFKAIPFAGDSVPARVSQPVASRGDCVDSQPGLSLEETYALSEPVGQAVSTFDGAATSAGYAARYPDSPLECDTSDSDSSINSYENAENRRALDTAQSAGEYGVPYILIIPQLTCDAAGTTATQLKVTLSISE